MKRSLAFAVVVCVACGGKTDGGEGTGGSGANAGSGGVSGGGAGGVSGGGAGGVSGGGAGGVSGGGAGGVSGGGAGGVGGLTSAVCNKLDQLPCAQPNCLSELKQAQQEAEQSGCSEEFTQLLQCVANSPIGCTPDGDVDVSMSCGPNLNQFAQCISQVPPPECSGFSDGSVCGVSCDIWSATCKTGPSGLFCQCDSGPNAGITFSLNNQTCSSPGLSTQAEQFCAPVFD